jgi:hypothetical protein
MTLAQLCSHLPVSGIDQFGAPVPESGTRTGAGMLHMRCDITNP